jgi:hypothetical protein
VLWLLGKAVEETEKKKFINMGYSEEESSKMIKRKK